MKYIYKSSVHKWCDPAHMASTHVSTEDCITLHGEPIKVENERLDKAGASYEAMGLQRNSCLPNIHATDEFWWKMFKKCSCYGEFNWFGIHWDLELENATDKSWFVLEFYRVSDLLSLLALIVKIRKHIV